MLTQSLLSAALFALNAMAVPVSDPIEMLRRDHSTGVVIQKCANPGQLALAFDDGPYQYTQQLVNTLDAAGAKATFFFTGTLYGCIYNQATAVKNAYNSGHQIASHTWTHPHIGSMGASQLQQEMTKLEQAFVNIFGKKPLYMRPPYLETGGSVMSTLRGMNYVVVTNDVDSQDWNGASVQQSQQNFQRAGAGGQGHIPLMHETYANTVNQLVPWLITWAQQNNLKLVTVAECLNDAENAYQPGTFTGNGQNYC